MFVDASNQMSQPGGICYWIYEQDAYGNSVSHERTDHAVICFIEAIWDTYSGLILGLRLANERRRYFVTTSLIRMAQA